MKVTVLGGGGYLGSAIAGYLAGSGHTVRAVDNFMYGHRWSEEMSSGDIELIHADYRSKSSLTEVLRGVDACIHMGGLVGEPACQVDVDLAVELTYTSVIGAAQVVDELRIPVFVAASTCSVYGAEAAVVDETSTACPIGVYAATKLGIERVVGGMLTGRTACAFPRFGTAFGLSHRPRLDTVVNLMSARAAAGIALEVRGGGQWRPFVHVLDIARSVELLMSSGYVGPINVGADDDNLTIADLAARIRAVSGATVHFGDTADNEDRRSYRVDFRRLAELGYRKTRTIEQGIAEIADAVRAGAIADIENDAYSNIRSLRRAIASGKVARDHSPWMRELVAAYPLQVMSHG
ncbi:NAD-dependent epimerase/dehydratase family protein [Nocardia niwae]|uniref:NAD-dependent epimerase/dehydratase family protein n=1 Tax=Nocardia niwae TaxID=626084 RepID=UPI0007A4724C|nr:NAD(P)-dependent oxidoreductase [Nocardia niwae]